MFQVRVGDLGVRGGGETEMASWGRSLWKLAGQPRGASQRWEEAGRRKLGPGDHRAASWPGNRRGGAGKSLGSRPTAGPRRGRGGCAQPWPRPWESAIFSGHRPGEKAEGELKPGAPLPERPPEPGLALLGTAGCSGKSCEAPELGLASAGIGFLPLPGFTLGGAQSTLIVPIPQTEGEAEWRQLSSGAQNWGTVLVQGCGSEQ